MLCKEPPQRTDSVQSFAGYHSKFENTPFGLARALRVSSLNDNVIVDSGWI